jgi:hypothetical protein
VRGIVVFLAIVLLGSLVGGFGMGLPELGILALAALVVAGVVATRTSGDHGPQE